LYEEERKALQWIRKERMLSHHVIIPWILLDMFFFRVGLVEGYLPDLVKQNV
jgi:hypothetical protein